VKHKVRLSSRGNGFRSTQPRPGSTSGIGGSLSSQDVTGSQHAATLKASSKPTTYPGDEEGDEEQASLLDDVQVNQFNDDL